jgi:benzylsuccinate CoA-transferase BbsF subunit
LGEEIMAAAADPERKNRRRGNQQDGIAQQDTYRCRDGRWIAVTLAAPDAGIADFCAARGSDAAVAELQTRGVAAAVCNDGVALLNDRTLAGVTLARDASGGMVKGLPYRLDGKGVCIENSAPDLGQHTDAVLRELLGLDDAELARLAKSGVTSTTPTLGDV